MENKFISLLYPDERSMERHQDSRNLPEISEAVCDELGLNEIFGLRNSSLTDFFTMDTEVIEYRQQTIRDMMNIPEIKKTLAEVHPILDDIRQLRILDNDDANTGDSYLYSITEIELYVSCIDTLKEGFVPVRDKIQSRAFSELCDFIVALSESEYYIELNKKLEDLSSRVREVKSVTIGVNLDRQLRPESAGVISINSEQFKSGKMLDKILRMSFKNDAFTCISELSPVKKGQSENRKEALMAAFNNAIEEVFKGSVKGWRNIVGGYVLDNTDFLLKLLPEIEFVSRATDLMNRLADQPGCNVCMPTVRPMEEKIFTATELYNPRVALAIDDEIVTNDFAFDDEARIYVLTGPNRGGKSVITVAVGASQALCQLGLPVPASSASISVADGIFTHFPEGADDTIDKGRLGEECARLKEIFDAVTPDSMILLDESLSSTGAYEATYIASEILSGFAALRCRGIFSTHLHDLAAGIADINARSLASGGIKIDTLVAGIEEGKRSFKIYRAKPDGKSYAKDIADKYGLSFEGLMQRARESEK
jgi:DNA mismatch repair ATPase MutS